MSRCSVSLEKTASGVGCRLSRLTVHLLSYTPPHHIPISFPSSIFLLPVFTHPQPEDRANLCTANANWDAAFAKCVEETRTERESEREKTERETERDYRERMRRMRQRVEWRREREDEYRREERGTQSRANIEGRIVNVRPPSSVHFSHAPPSTSSSVSLPLSLIPRLCPPISLPTSGTLSI